ncbi:sulfurtransferase complex subunit TusD [uncultured Psychrobacter sp.]|uniref:sulfurtransferase complex subunit TusD n=1 Tax=uncultured Psychrobacter sp. TaxID=259303 RepID=UPI00260B30E7|nr:sulfurtransferase complex subunit TusD [uncultured Psychrobacter sp.]
MTVPITNKPTPLLLITTDPGHPLAHLALRYARTFLKQITSKQVQHHDESTGQQVAESVTQPLNVFFYADAAHIANRLRWQSADQTDLTKEWQALAKQYQLSLPVCVSTALSRGVSDNDNSTRHQLNGENIANGFHLVGLSDLAMMMQSNCRLLQF